MFLDPIQVGRDISRELRAAGADLIVALTHMRQPNDDAVAAGLQDSVDLVLGGHDHDASIEMVCVWPAGLWLCGGLVIGADPCVLLGGPRPRCEERQ